MHLADRVAVVTGSAHRVGKAIALGLAAQGMRLVIHYHRAADEARRTLAELRELGVRATSQQADLSTEAGADALFAALDGEFADLAVLVNSAAIFQRTAVLSMNVADWDRVLDTNLRSAFLCSQRAARRMLASDHGGAIVNISDLSAFQPWADYPAHSVSKAGLDMLTRVMAKALAPTIRVNAVAAGPVEKAQGWDDARWEAIGRRLPLRRTGRASDVVEAVVFLLTQDFITGETLVVDGGGRLGQIATGE